MLGSDAEAFGGYEVGLGVRLAVDVVAGADEGFELVEDAQGGERGGDGFASAAGDDGEGEFAVAAVDVFKDVRDGG